MSAPASAIAGSVTAGSCQSQSIDACRSHDERGGGRAGGEPAPAPQRVARRDTHDAAEHEPEREQADEPELGGHLELDRVGVPHRLGDLAFA